MTQEEIRIAQAACCVGTMWDQYEGTEEFNKMVGKRVQHLIELVRNHLQQVQPEVDFETEYAKFSNDPDALDYAFPIDLADYKDFARHFYELGLNARNNHD